MTLVTPRDPADIPELAPMLDGVKAAMGFIPNSMLTMAHMPQLPIAFSLLANVVFGGDLRAQLALLAPLAPAPDGGTQNLSPDLIQLVAFAVSLSSGCRYCQAHTSHGAHRRGVDDAKLAEILDYDQSPRYSSAERAALALAFAAGQVPNESKPEHFAALRAHYTERQSVQLVSVIALFGFLNRWNDTMATTLESEPYAFATATLGSVDWTVGKHSGRE